MKAWNQKTLILPVVIGAAALVAVAWGYPRSAPGVSPEPSVAAAAATAPAMGGEAAPAPAAGAIAGKVAEKIDVTQYTYLRLTRPDGSEVWAAVPQEDVAVGSQVTVVDAQLMQAFKSSTLNRTFDAIYFGSLGAPGATHGGANSHGADPHGAAGPMGKGLPPMDDGTDPHGRPAAGGDEVKIGKIERAGGPNGKSVAEVHAGKAALGGKAVRIRGVVVKAVPGVLGRTFVHLRDGSGDAAQGTHDVTITTAERPEVGQTVLYEGNVAVDKDFGSGYRYPVLVEDARSVTE